MTITVRPLVADKQFLDVRLVHWLAWAVLDDRFPRESAARLRFILASRCGLASKISKVFQKQILAPNFSVWFLRQSLH
jgi:hypothetical protein